MSNTPFDLDAVLTEAEAAKRLGVKPGTLAAWRCRNSTTLPFLKYGNGAVRYKALDLMIWMDSQRQQPAMMK